MIISDEVSINVFTLTPLCPGHPWNPWVPMAPGGPLSPCQHREGRQGLQHVRWPREHADVSLDFLREHCSTRASEDKTNLQVRPHLQGVLDFLDILQYPERRHNQILAPSNQFQAKKSNKMKGPDTLNPGVPTVPRSPLVPIHLHCTPQHCLSAMVSCAAKNKMKVKWWGEKGKANPSCLTYLLLTSSSTSSYSKSMTLIRRGLLYLNPRPNSSCRASSKSVTRSSPTRMKLFTPVHTPSVLHRDSLGSVSHTWTRWWVGNRTVNPPIGGRALKRQNHTEVLLSYLRLF